MKIKNYKALCLDIHGVLYNSSSTGNHQVVKGSIESLRRLKEKKFPFLLVTNESQITADVLLQKLLKFGFELNKSEIYTPITAIMDTVQNDNLKPFCIIPDSLKSAMKSYTTADCNSVIITDAVDNFTYSTLNEAFNILIKQPTCRFISAGKGKYYSDAQQGLKLDLGVFTHALEYASGREAEIIGKPSEHYFQGALKKLGFSAEETIMIGDDLFNDVGGAQKLGMAGILVRSGKYRPEDENNPKVKPDLIVDNLLKFVDDYLFSDA